MKAQKWKPILNWTGFVLGLLGVAFVVKKLLAFSDQIRFSGFSPFSLCVLAGLVVAYLIANVFQSLAWYDLLRHLGVRVNARWAVHTYGLSQIAKYIPGNIFQFAGRQAIGQAAKLPGIPLAKSSVWEIGMLAFTGAFFSVLVGPLFLERMSCLAAIGIFLAAVSAALLCLWHWSGKYAASAMMWDLLFLTSSGMVFYGVMALTATERPEGQLVFIGITGTYVVAWLAGLVTPGAPAGIGVREVVFLAVLHPLIPQDELLKLVLTGRFVTVSGDVLFYLLSLLCRFRQKANAGPAGLNGPA